MGSVLESCWMQMHMDMYMSCMYHYYYYYFITRVFSHV
jgi:hypothetical protein